MLCFLKLKKILIAIVLLILFVSVLSSAGCRKYDDRLDVVYFFKTGPEKAVIDFLQSLDNDDSTYIYENLMPLKDKNNISKERFIIEFDQVISDLESIEIMNTYYLGFEDDMSKVVAEFKVTYKSGQEAEYKKYIYLIEENNGWKIVFEKTFI